jgi:hypothetical protein
MTGDKKQVNHPILETRISFTKLLDRNVCKKEKIIIWGKGPTLHEYD